MFSAREGRDGALVGITSWLDACRVGIFGLAAVISSLTLADAVSSDNHQSLPVAAADDVAVPSAPSLPDVGVMALRSQSWHAARTQIREQASAEANLLAQEVAAREVAVSDFLDDVASVMSALSDTDDPEPASVPEPARPAAASSAPAPPTTAAPATSTTAASPVAGDSWTRLRQCESSGNYQNVNGSGRYRGAYQFSQTTWDWVAGIRYPHLIGVDPAAASAGDQDAMAQALYELQGPGAWPSCGSAFS